MTKILGNLLVDAENGVVDATGAHTISNFGVTASQALYKNGAASIYFPGTSSGKYYVATDVDFNFGLNDFTIDTWINLKKIGWNTVLNIGNFGSTSSLLWLISGSEAYVGSNSDNQWYPATGTTLSLNTWYHYAITRKSGIIYLFLNGHKFAETSQYSTLNISSSVGGVTVGIYGGSTTNPFYGNMDDLRIIKGTALWDDDFELTGLGLFTEEDVVLTPLTSIYKIGHRGNIRGKAKAGFIRPTIKEFFTSTNYLPN